MPSTPPQEMQRLYIYLELPPARHKYSDIAQTTKEDDAVYGFEDLHTIRPRLEMNASDAQQILGKDVCDWMKKTYSWYYEYFGYK